MNYFQLTLAVSQLKTVFFEAKNLEILKINIFIVNKIQNLYVC